MALPIQPFPKRVDVAATGSPSNFFALQSVNANAFRCCNKTAGWANVYITTDQTQAVAGSPPVAQTVPSGPGITNFDPIAFGVPIPPNSFIDYRVPVNQQVFGSAWLDSGAGTISFQPVSV